MALRLPNLTEISKKDPKIAEALEKVQTYVTANTTPAAGHRKTAPSGFVNPGKPSG